MFCHLSTIEIPRPYFSIVRDKMEKLKREKWKNKYFWVVRNKGKLVTHRKYSKKLNKELIFSIYKNNNTLYANIKKNRLKTKNYSEYVIDDLKENIKKPKQIKSRPYRYQITAIIEGEYINANSRTTNWGNVRQARNEAYQRFYYAVSKKVNGTTDEDEGKVISQNIRDIDERIVYYD